MGRFVAVLWLAAAAVAHGAAAAEPAGAARGAGAIACTVRADSTLASPRFAPERLFDGRTTDPESRWASARSPEPHWVVWTLAEPVTIDRVVVHCHGEPDLAMRSATLEVQEGDGWRGGASIEGNVRTPVTFSLAPCAAVSLRLWITDACLRDSTARLLEIEMFAGDKRIEAVVTAPGRTARPAVDDRTLVESVEPLPDRLFAAPDANDRNGRLLAACARAMALWGEVLSEQIRPVPGRPGQAYYGLGAETENDVRPIGYAVMLNGLLWRMREATAAGAGPPSTDPRAGRRRDDAIAALRYLTASHVTGPSTCLSGKPWGDGWQSAMWARAAGMGAWALWDELDGDLALAAARMIEHEADRFLDQAPKSSVNRDTGAEENAWNALILSLAANMMSRHPRAAEWDRAAKRYMYNVFSVPADAENDSAGDDGLPVKAWVSTVNAHDDFTVENHGLVHLGYQKTSVAQLLENAVHYLVAGREPPAACRHHVAEAAELLYRCAGWDGSPVYFGGNDWKIVHSQPTDLPIYSALSIVAGDGRAALQEQRGLERVGRLQAAEGRFFNERRDLEYGGLCATRLATCYLAHAAAGAGAEPISPEEFDRQMTGAWHLEGGRAMLHRTPDKFASFAFGPKWLALTLPRGPDRTIWPHFASYLGVIDGEYPTETQGEFVHRSPASSGDGFWVVGRLGRCGGKLVQDFAFIAPATDVTVYVERFRGREGFRPAGCETGVIGHEYEIGSNRRTLFGPFGSLEVQGTGGDETTRELAGDWLNVGQRIGYVVRRLPETENVIRYHDLAAGEGRAPKLQEWFSLVGDRGGRPAPGGDRWACIATLPNRSANETERWAEQVRLEADSDTATVRLEAAGEKALGSWRVDFGEGKVVPASPGPDSPKAP
ncbi:MAG: discoidin domain-containing protein [Thermoguttaceae bacterium]